MGDDHDAVDLEHLLLAMLTAREGPPLPVDGFITDKTLPAGVTDRVILADMSWTEGDGIPVDAPPVRLDDLCRVVLPPFRADDTTVEAGTVRDVPGLWIRPKDRPCGTILYLHGGGYIFVHRLLQEYFAGLATEESPV